MDDKRWQEFYCNDCHIYIRVRLNMALNVGVVVVCPMCCRKHPRAIVDGQIKETGHSDQNHEICPPKSACSKEPWTKFMRNNTSARDGVEIKESEIPPRDPASDAMIKELWFERYGGSQGD